MQFHPEFKSKPLQPHPLFAGFVEASLPAQDGAARRATRRRGRSRGQRSDRRRSIQSRDPGRRSATSRIGGGRPLVLIAGPCVIESEAHAHRHRRARSRTIARARRRAVHLQGVVRQGEPHVGHVVPRPGPRRRPARARARQGAHRRADPHRHPRAGAGGAGGRGRRRPADSGVPLAADRPARRRGAAPAASSTSRRASSSRRDDMRHAIAKVDRRRQPARDRHRARHQLRLPQPRRRHARVPDDARARRTRSSSTSRTACSCRAAATASPPARREYIEPLASAGVAAGVDGVFLEVHEEPARAKSDAQNALRLDLLEPLLAPAGRDRRDRQAAAREPR